jgi:hypothetical protein
MPPNEAVLDQPLCVRHRRVFFVLGVEDEGEGKVAHLQHGVSPVLEIDGPDQCSILKRERRRHSEIVDVIRSRWIEGDCRAQPVRGIRYLASACNRGGGELSPVAISLAVAGHQLS